MKILTVVIFFLLEIITSEFAVGELLFLDSTPILQEKIIYHLVTLPPFIAGLILIHETRNLNKTFIYITLFYMVSIATVLLFLKAPEFGKFDGRTTSGVGSDEFFQTGGGFGALSLIPQAIVTVIAVYFMKKNLK